MPPPRRPIELWPYIVMADIVMADIVMANIVMADIVMASRSRMTRASSSSTYIGMAL